MLSYFLELSKQNVGGWVDFPQGLSITRMS